MYSIFSLIKQFYDKWHIHIFVLSSLLLQTILTLFAPFRKRARGLMVTILVWIIYLLADWTAIFAVGLISNSQKDDCLHPNEQADILAFWAPFLLLHLGGPDTITAFAIQDNAFWLRHSLGFITQALSTIIVINQSLPRNKLWLPCVLIFVDGTIKYGERTRALYLAEENRYRKSMLKEPDPGHNFEKLAEVYSSSKKANLPVEIERAKPKELKSTEYKFQKGLKDLEVLRVAYEFYEIFKGLIVDRVFTFKEANKSKIFLEFTSYAVPEDAFGVLAIELNFMYEDLYTKVRTVHSVFGYIARFISLCTVIAALSTFFSLDKSGFHRIEIGITYSLLFGAICLDSIALFRLVFSDWTTNSIQNSKNTIWMAPVKKYFLPLLESFLSLKKITWASKSTSQWEFATQVLFRRWSGCLYKYNLIYYCLNPESSPAGHALNVVAEYFGLKNVYERMTYVEDKPLKKYLWRFIFHELKQKSYLLDDLETAAKIRLSRGDFAIEKNVSSFEIRKSLMHYIINYDYDQSLIIWHIATDLCNPTKKTKFIGENNYPKFCKQLSDYMLYLLIMQPTMMSVVGRIGEIAFYDTCAEARRFFNENSITEEEDAHHKILGINTDLSPFELKGNKSKSLLFDACILAKELKKLGEKQWEVMSKVWVELLSYAASHCKADSHATQLCKGGELITFIWLLMAHFGMGEKFEINIGRMNKALIPEAKLIIGK